MDFKLTSEQEEFRQKFREFLESEAELCARAIREEEYGSFGPNVEEFHRKAGARGYLAAAWPKKYGGLELSHMEKYIVDEELAYAIGIAAFGTGASMAGPCMLMFGSDEMKEEFLPKIASGEIEFALGYTEPESGSDLASLQMRAVRDGDHYIINGQKVFNTSCHYAHYHWLAARTDPKAPKHKGISMFVVDMDAPGITIRPMYGMGGVRTNEVFYDDVKVPASRLVGEENKGWEYLAAALAFERNWQVGYMLYQFEKFLEFAKTFKRNGQLLIENPIIGDQLAQLAIEVEVSRLFGLRVACMQEKSEIPTWEASVGKVFGSELWYKMSDTWMKIIDFYGQLEADSDCTLMESRVMQWYFLAARSVITRGTNEIMKNMIAMRGLGLPRS